MIKSRTYNGQAGLNYIQSSDLAFATVYVVKRSGLQYDKYVSGSTNRTHIHDPNTGKIYFINGFEASNPETVFVIFKTSTGVEPEYPPGVCIPVTITPPILEEDAQVSTPYSRTYALTGTTPFTLIPITVPSWGTLAIINLRFVRLTGTPDAEGTEALVFDVSNCGGSTDSINDSFQVLPLTDNLYVSNAFFTTINSVTGITYVLTSWHFPAIGGIPVIATHGDYTGTITVNVSNIVFPRTLTLKRNSVTLEAIPVTSNGDYTFASQVYLTADIIEIILE